MTACVNRSVRRFFTFNLHLFPRNALTMARQTRPQHPINRLVPSALFAILALGQAASAVESYTVRSLPVPAGIDPATTTDQWAEKISRNGNWAVFIWEVAGNPRQFLWSRVDNSLTELIVPAGYEFNIGHLGNSVNGNVYGSLEKYDVNGDTTEAWPAKASKASPTVVQFGTIQGMITSVGADDVMFGLYQPGAIAATWYPSGRACTWATTTTTTPTPVTFPGTTLNGATTFAVRPWDSSTETIWGAALFGGSTASRAFRYTPGTNALVSWDATAFHGAQADSTNWNATQGFSDGTAIWDLGNEDGGGVGNPCPKRAFWVTNIDAVGGPTQFTIPLLPGKVAISKQYGVAKLTSYTMLAGVCGEGNGNENNNTKTFLWYSNEPNTAYEFKLRVLGHTDSSTSRLYGGPTHVTTGGEIFSGGLDANEQFHSNAARRPILASPAATVSVSLSANSVPENSGTAITITATRTNHPGALTDYLLARFSVTGTATAGSDYTVTGGTFSGGTLTISIPVGATTAAATLTPIDNSAVSPDKTVTITPAAPTNIPDVWTTCKGFINGSGAALTIVNDDVATNPQPVITRSGSGATRLPLTVTITFDEAVVNVASGDLTASTGTLGAITGSGTTYTATWTPPAASEGSATLQIAAGTANAADDNAASLASNLLTITYDTLAPTITAGPTLVTDGGRSNSDGVINDSTPDVVGTVSEANAVVRLYDAPSGGILVGTTTASGTSWAATLATLADGGNAIYAEAVDALGNTSARVGPLDLTIDTLPPTAATVTTAPPAMTNAVPTVWGGANEANVDLAAEVTNGGVTTIVGGAIEAGTTWNRNLTLADGTYSVRFRSVDVAGNTSFSASTNVLVETTGPSVALTGTTTIPTGGSAVVTATYTDAGTGVSSISLSSNQITVTTTGDVTTGAVSVSGGGTASRTITIASVSGTAGTIVVSIAAGTALDGAGNPATASSTFIITVDGIVPVTPTIALAGGSDSGANDNVTNVVRPTLSGTTESGTTVAISDGATALGAAVVVGTTWTFATTADLADGIHSLHAVATDGAGNTSPTASLNVTIDTQIAVPTVTSSGLANGSPTISGTASPNTQIQITGTGFSPLSTTSNGSGDWTVTGSGVTEGVYVLTVTSTDVATNSASTTSNLQIDTTGPSVVLTGAALIPSRVSTALTATYADSALSVASISLSAGNVSISTTGDVTVGPTTVSGTDAAWRSITIFNIDGTSGTIVVSVAAGTAADTVGNPAAASNTFIITVDGAAPTSPTIALAPGSDSGAADRITKIVRPVLAGTTEAGTTVVVKDGATVLGSATVAGTTWTFSTTADLADGVHALKAIATDTAGNVSPEGALSVTIDTQIAAPTVANPAIVTSSSDIAISGTASPSSTIQIAGSGFTTLTTAVDGLGAWSVSAVGVAEGTYALTVTASDVATNSASITMSLVVDRTAPATPTSTGLTLLNTTTPTLAGTAEAGTTVTVKNGATVIGTAVANGSGQWTLTVSSALPEGATTLTITATDAVGNTSSAATVTVTIDTIAPVAPVVAAMTSTTVTTQTPTLSGTAEAGSTVVIKLGSTVIGTAVADSAGAWTIVVSALPAGANTLSFTARDPAGNTSSAMTLIITVVLPQTDENSKSKCGLGGGLGLIMGTMLLMLFQRRRSTKG